MSKFHAKYTGFVKNGRTCESAAAVPPWCSKPSYPQLSSRGGRVKNKGGVSNGSSIYPSIRKFNGLRSAGRLCRNIGVIFL